MGKSGNRFVLCISSIVLSKIAPIFFEKNVVFLQESGRMVRSYFASPFRVKKTMISDTVSDTVIVHSRSSVLSDNTAPYAEPVQEVHELSELLRWVDALPSEHRPDFYCVLDRFAACLESRHRMLGYVQESLNQMSLDLKYLIFDLEATRRERDEYRRMLEPPPLF
jgi:hypothetical protein